MKSHMICVDGIFCTQTSEPFILPKGDDFTGQRLQVNKVPSPLQTSKNIGGAL